MIRAIVVFGTPENPLSIEATDFSFQRNMDIECTFE